MKVLAILLLCLAASASATKCRLPSYTCIDKKTFCDGKRVLACPTGTTCKTPPAGKQRSPCVAAKVAGSCPYSDFICASKYSFCLGGEEIACAPSTMCKGGIGKGMAPCRTIQTPDDPVPGECTQDAYKCRNAISFCLEGHPINCPAGTTCIGFGPCVNVY